MSQTNADSNPASTDEKSAVIGETSNATSGAKPGSKAGSAYPEPVDRLIGELAKLPGIGRRSAERLAFHILKGEASLAAALSKAIADVKEAVKNCRICYNLADRDECGICTNAARDRGLVLVVEQPKDLLALEHTGLYRGVYHVLMGRISPLEGIGASDLTIHSLLERIDHAEKNCGGTPVREVVLGLNPTLEGDGTGLYLASELKARGVRVSRLARGLPTGSQLEYANKAVLADAIEGRQQFGA